jgi:ankyrin repeat protein
VLILYTGLQEVAEEHRDVSREHRDIAKEQLQAQIDLAKGRLFEEEQECHQLFRLTTSSRDTTYEWYKDRVEERVEDTCMWFLKHEHFQTWLNQESGPLLVTADPGCGKSVLAKYLVDYGLPRSTTICYFFFKDQDQNTVRQALCALLHQLFSLKPPLIKHAMPQFRKDGQGLINSTESLWNVLRNATKDPQSGPIIIVLDALDECAESEFTDLMRNVESQFRSDQLGYGKFKYLLTCRSYDQIVSKFRSLLRDFRNIRIPGEEESETISQEVNHVITRRINQMAMEKRLSTQIKSHLEKILQETTHRTYLWVYLVFDYLEKDDFKKTLKGVESAIATLPRSINEAYEQILNKSKEDPMVRKALSIILAASRPLTLSEMNIAVNIDYTSQSIYDLDLEDDEDFKRRLRSWCGLFVSIHQGNIYFLHQTAREFLLADLASPTTVSSELHWHHSITTRQAHAVLAELCVLYLNFLNSNVSLLTDMDGEAGHSVVRHPFLDYSAKTWGTHFRKAGFIDNATIIPFALRICDSGSKSYSVWFRIYWETTGLRTTKYFTDLMLASYYGHHVIVKPLLEKGAEIEARDSEFGGTPLLWATENGHEAVIKLLLEKGVDVESKDKYGRTPLLWAAINGYKVIINLLLEKGAEIEARDSSFGRTPLLWAAKNGYKAVIKLLLEKGADVESKDNINYTPLLWATINGHEAIIKLLLEKGAKIEAKDSQYGRTPLLWAATNGYKVIINLLLEKGADIKSKDNIGQTPLLWAAKNGHEAIVKLLLEKGANVEPKDKIIDWTPLSRAAQKGYEAIIVKLLLATEGIDVDLKDKYGRTPLLWAAANGHEAVVKLLLATEGIDVDLKDKYGRTPLSWAAANGHKAIIKLLLPKGNARTEDTVGRTPLSFAAKNGHDAVAMALLRHDSIDPDQEDHYGSTPLSIAVRNSRIKIVNMLLATGQVSFHSQDRFGRTLWYWARRCGNIEIQQVLLDYAETRGIAVCENNDELIEEGPISNDGTSRWCDICTLSIPEDVVFYHCEVCNGGDFDICSRCYKIGGRCLGDDHGLAQNNTIKK